MAKVISSKSVLVSFLVSLSLICTTGRSSPVSVGDTMIEIPNPPGFAPVTPDMTTAFELTKQFVASTNREFFSYIPESEVLKAASGEIPAWERRCSVQTYGKLVDMPISGASFSEFKHTMKTQMGEITKKAEEAMPGLLRNANEYISKQYDVDPALSVSQMVPLPPHEEAGRTLAFSMFGKTGYRDASGRPISSVFTATATIVHIKARILFLYAFGGESDLDWTRTISKQWAGSVIAANPPDARSSAREALPPAPRGVDWGSITERAIAKGIGATIVFGLFGLLLGAVGLVRRRRGGQSGEGAGEGKGKQ
jgi:hypothetical protein